MKLQLDEENIKVASSLEATDGVDKQSLRKERRHAEFFDVVSASLSIASPEDFCAWLAGDFRHIFPHEMLACGLGLFENQKVHLDKILTCNFPQQYMQDLRKAGGLSASPVVQQWAQTRKSVLFSLEKYGQDTPWGLNLKKHGIHNIAAHGQCDISSHTTSYFSFFNIPVNLTPRHGQLLEMLLPHLHVALTRALSGMQDVANRPEITLYGLTARESEILQWVASGKTNGEIAQILHISEYTVKNHVQRILSKLKVKTRTEAVGKGLQKISK